MSSTLRMVLVAVCGISLLTAAVTWLFSATEAEPVPSVVQPTVLFVVMDTVRADHTSLCGYDRPTTPTLEALRADGASVSCGGVAPGSWTIPSVASFFTGMQVIGIRQVHPPPWPTGQPNLDFTTIPPMLLAPRKKGAHL